MSVYLYIISKNEMGGPCSALRRRGDLNPRVWWENVKESDHLIDTGVDRTTIVKCVFRKEYGGVDWIILAQVTPKWSAVLKTTAY